MDFPGGYTRNEPDSLLTAKRHRNSIKDVKCFRGTDYDTSHILVITRIKSRIKNTSIAEGKNQGTKVNFKKLKDMFIREKYQLEIMNRSEMLEVKESQKDNKRTWVNMKESVKKAAVRP